MITLEEHIRSLSIDHLRRNYATELRDWSDTDSAVRKSAKLVLNEFQVEGDSWGVPSIEDIVEKLVDKIQELSK